MGSEFLSGAELDTIQGKFDGVTAIPNEVNGVSTGMTDALRGHVLELIAEVRCHRAAAKLLAEDVLFCVEPDPEGEGSSPYVILLSDTFAYACADCERIPLHEIPYLLFLYDKFGYSGPIAWAAVKRGCDPIKPHMDDEYREAVKCIRQRNSICLNSTNSVS